MMRQTLVASLAVFAFGALTASCKAGGVGDPCIPNLEFSANYAGGDEQGVGIEDRSFQCETRVCITNHFRGRVSCPFGNPKGGSVYTDPKKKNDKECLVPGTNLIVTAGVKPQCRERKDFVYCSCRCGGDDPAAKYCDCPSGFACEQVTNSLDKTIMRPNDKYCVRQGNDYHQDGKPCCAVDNPNCPDRCDKDDYCNYSSNRPQI